jgi:phospholipid transport system substrate-binding protein
MRLLHVRAIAIAMLAFCCASASVPALEPVAVITEFNTALVDLMRTAKGLTFDQRVERIEGPVTNTFDLRALALIALGSHARKQTETDISRYLDAFSTLVVNTYAARFTDFGGESFVVDGQRPARRGRMLVTSRIVRPAGADVRLNYLLQLTDNSEWRVVNVVAEGVSEIAIRRAEYDALLRRAGIAELIDALVEQTRHLRE